MNIHEKNEALSLLRTAANRSDYETRRMLFHVHNLVSGQKQHSRVKIDWQFLGLLASAFVLVIIVGVSF